MSKNLCFLTLLLVNGGESQIFKEIKCPVLQDKGGDNVVVECYNEGGRAVDCGMPLMHGSLANYSCPKYFKPALGLLPYPQDLYQGSVVCADGEWKFLRSFRKYACVPECSIESSTMSLGELPPWHVLIKKEMDPGEEDGENECTGTLIPSLVGNASIILTHRNCISDKNGLLRPDKMTVEIRRRILGLYYTFNVSSIFMHPNPNAEIVILNVTRPVVLSSGVHPICLTTREDRRSGIVFAMDDFHKRLVNMTVESREFCHEAGYHPKEDEFCAVKSISNGKSCPDIVEPFLATQNQMKYELHGIGKGSLRVDSCSHYLGVYTKIFPYLSWIRETQSRISGVGRNFFDSTTTRNIPTGSSRRSSTTHRPYTESNFFDTTKTRNSPTESLRTSTTHRPYTESRYVTTTAGRHYTTFTPRNSSIFSPIISLGTPPFREVMRNRTQNVSTSNGHRNLANSHVECPPLPKNDRNDYRFDIQCQMENDSSESLFDCMNTKVPKGTKAVYKCKRDFASSSTKTFATRKCKGNGEWEEAPHFSCDLLNY